MRSFIAGCAALSRTNFPVSGFFTQKTREDGGPLVATASDESASPGEGLGRRGEGLGRRGEGLTSFDGEGEDGRGRDAEPALGGGEV